MLTFLPTAPADSEEIRGFLQRIFHTPDGHRPFEPDVMHWKSWAPHPLWEGSRSYALRQDGRLVAHGCVTPMQCHGPQGPLRTACVIDWAASPEVAGAGVLLFRKVAQMLDGLTAVGGSDDTRRVLPRMGFQVRCQMTHFVRWVRPGLHHWRHGRKDWKLPARLARDWGRMRPQPGIPAGWTSQPIGEFPSGWPEEDQGKPRAGYPAAMVCDRSAALLNYWLACPAAEMRGFIAQERGAPAGWFVLARVGPENRIAGWAARPGGEAALIALALDAASRHPEVTRVRWPVTAARWRELARATGWHQEREEPVFYWNSARREGSGEPDYDMSLLDNDGFYLP
jgi:hypothetical protein